MLRSQEFLNDQAETLSRVQRYCAATSMSVPVDPYVFSYDSGSQLLVCRNHKVVRNETIQCLYNACCIVTGCFLHPHGDIQSAPLRSTSRCVRWLTEIFDSYSATLNALSSPHCRTDKYIDKWGTTYTWTTEHFKLETAEHVR